MANQTDRSIEMGNVPDIPLPFSPVPSPINTSIPTSPYGGVTTQRKPESSNGTCAPC